MEFKELIKVRRSCRNYQADVVIEKEVIEDIIRDAQQCPTWKNTQTGRFYVVCSPEKVAELREKCLPAFNQASTANCSAYIVTTYKNNIAGFNKKTGEPDNELGNVWGAYDLGYENAYMVLSAADHGLDTLIMGIRDAEAVKTLLEIPDDQTVVGVIALGKKAAENDYFPRKDVEAVAKFI